MDKELFSLSQERGFDLIENFSLSCLKSRSGCCKMISMNLCNFVFLIVQFFLLVVVIVQSILLLLFFLIVFYAHAISWCRRRRL